jgi:hypothetical protein
MDRRKDAVASGAVASLWRLLCAMTMILSSLGAISAGLVACGSSPAQTRASGQDEGVHVPTSIARPPTVTPTPSPLQLTIIHTNDTWGYLLPCG